MADVNGEIAGPKPYLEADFFEGGDFSNHDDLVDVIATRLETLGVDNVEELIVSGYNYDEPRELTAFYGMTIAEYREMVELGESWTPFHFGVLHIFDGQGRRRRGEIAIGVYRPDSLLRIPDSHEFTHRDGKCVDEEKIAVFRILRPGLDAVE